MIPSISDAGTFDTSKSSCKAPRTFMIEGNPIQLCWAERLDAWISSECLTNSKVLCGANKLARSAKHKDADLDEKALSGGKNPGSVLCSKLGGEVMIAKLPSGSQVTFCQAKDRTLIDCNALANQFQAVN